MENTANLSDYESMRKIICLSGVRKNKTKKNLLALQQWQRLQQSPNLWILNIFVIAISVIDL